MPNPTLKSPQRDVQTLGKNAICLVSPNGEVTITQLDEQSIPTHPLETITRLQSHPTFTAVAQ